jgi:hypothetical protein
MTDESVVYMEDGSAIDSRSGLLDERMVSESQKIDFG